MVGRAPFFYRMLLVLALPVIACAGSGPHPALASARTAANSAALVYETSEATALLLYRAEQQLIVDQAQREGWTQEQARAAVGLVRAWWEQVWAAFRGARSAHEALALAVEAADAAERAGKQPDIANLLQLAARVAEAERAVAALLAQAKAKQR